MPLSHLIDSSPLEWENNKYSAFLKVKLWNYNQLEMVFSITLQRGASFIISPYSCCALEPGEPGFKFQLFLPWLDNPGIKLFLTLGLSCTLFLLTGTLFSPYTWLASFQVMHLLKRHLLRELSLNHPIKGL